MKKVLISNDNTKRTVRLYSFGSEESIATLINEICLRLDAVAPNKRVRLFSKSDNWYEYGLYLSLKEFETVKYILTSLGYEYELANNPKPPASSNEPVKEVKVFNLTFENNQLLKSTESSDIYKKEHVSVDDLFISTQSNSFISALRYFLKINNYLFEVHEGEETRIYLVPETASSSDEFISIYIGTHYDEFDVISNYVTNPNVIDVLKKFSLCSQVTDNSLYQPPDSSLSSFSPLFS